MLATGLLESPTDAGLGANRELVEIHGIQPELRADVHARPGRNGHAETEHGSSGRDAIARTEPAVTGGKASVEKGADAPAPLDA